MNNGLYGFSNPWIKVVERENISYIQEIVDDYFNLGH